MKKLLFLFLLFMSIVHILPGQILDNHQTEPVNIIFDTDLGSDCDDAGALAILHHLADIGEANILAVIYSSGKNRYGAGACDAINTWYGRGDIPIGQYAETDVGDPLNMYSGSLAKNTATYGHNIIDKAEEMLTVYKRTLREQPDSSVTLVVVGHPNGVCHLMRDPEGMRLIRQKIITCISMAATPSQPVRDWNLGRNGVEYYTREFLENWPKDIYFSTAGKDILTGHRLLPLTPENNPVREAYRLFYESFTKGRMSWDQIALLFAVRPDWFVVDSKGELVQTEQLETWWDPNGRNPLHHKITPIICNEDLTAIIEAWMSWPPLSF